jgi:hypothetical protein
VKPGHCRHGGNANRRTEKGVCSEPLFDAHPCSPLACSMWWFPQANTRCGSYPGGAGSACGSHADSGSGTDRDTHPRPRLYLSCPYFGFHRSPRTGPPNRKLQHIRAMTSKAAGAVLPSENECGPLRFRQIGGILLVH